MKRPLPTACEAAAPGGSFAAIPRWKRPLDLACIGLTLPIWAPVMLLISAVIKLVSRGPILFRQERLGYLGQPFQCLKFRTMRVDGGTAVHQSYLKDLIHSEAPMTKMDVMGDPRLIPFAALLRATGLDELPQLFNVIRGQMSLVGPRPCTRYEYEDYRPWHHYRFYTLPGLTGLWQISGKNKTTFTEMINLDILYARNKSPGMDVRIMFKTFPVLAGQLAEILKRKASRARGPERPASLADAAGSISCCQQTMSIRNKEELCRVR